MIHQFFYSLLCSCYCIFLNYNISFGRKTRIRSSNLKNHSFRLYSYIFWHLISNFDNSQGYVSPNCLHQYLCQQFFFALLSTLLVFHFDYQGRRVKILYQSFQLFNFVQRWNNFELTPNEQVFQFLLRNHYFLYFLPSLMISHLASHYLSFNLIFFML